MGKVLPYALSRSVLLALALSACGSRRDPSSALSYNPALSPGQVFFNPQAPWVREWANTPLPREPQQEISSADPNGDAFKTEANAVPWTVVKGDGQVETLASGMSPTQVFPGETLPALRTADAFQRAEPESPWANPNRGPASVAELADRSDPRRIIPGDRNFPLANSLAVESVRADAYYKHAYSWVIPTAQVQPFYADDGRVLNAFFFVRKRGEKWENLSFMLYGTRKHAAELRRWNGDRPLKVGTILYYNSSARPDDTERMIPITEDFRQKYVYRRLRPGESLSIFGKRYYGEWRTWREIAFLNSIAEPHEVPKRRLKLQPRALGHQRSTKAKVRVPTSLPKPSAE